MTFTFTGYKGEVAEVVMSVLDVKLVEAVGWATMLVIAPQSLLL